MSARFTLFSAATAVVVAPLLYDAALKGVLLLAAAGLVVLGLRRASAAARHLVWLVSMVTLLVVPVLTVALPGWRVLPAWTAWPKPPADVPHQYPLSVHRPRAETGATAPPMTPSAETPSTNASAPIVPLPERPSPAPSQPARAPVRAPAPPVSAATWAVAAWTAGFLLLSVRLLAAHCLLRRARRRAEPCLVGPLADALTEAAIQLEVRQPVTLRLDTRRTIPLVWGVLRPCLLLPSEARQWNRDQLRSVLLHELAHLKRRDPLVQALAQVALALHWFNPLAWLAVWRLHVERERSCDDLVLASGVRSSEYATHLLRVATELTSAPWTSAGGLAMARRSSLEARLRAVLNDRCNRRSMTRALTTAALLLALALAIPVAMLRATEEAWNPPNAAHIVTNSFSAYCVHGLEDVAFVLAYPGQTSSSSAHDSNSKTRTWTDTGTFTAIQPDIALGFHRQHTAPDTLVLTTTPASARYLSKPAPAPRPFGQKTFDLKQGRVFLLADNATIRQLDLPAPLVTDTASAKQLAALIAALPPPAPETQKAKPTHESAQSLFRKWQSRARIDGKIPGALIRQLSSQVREFIKQYPDTDEARKLAALRPRFEAAAARDWGPAEAAGLLDDVAAITTAPVGWASLPMEFDTFSTIKTGEPLPVELSSAAWGPPAENGLRAAWLLEPRAEQYALGTVLKVRVLFHNAGTQPVVFRTETWHQSDTLTVRDAQGADVKTTGTWYTGITPLANYRLLPGEYCEVSAPGVAIGAGPYEDERNTGRLGVVIEAKEGDTLSLSCLVDAALGITFSRPGDPNDPQELWKKQVADRVTSEAPLPQAPADREQLIRRVLLDLTGAAPTAEEIAQFVHDSAPNALDTLTARIQAREPTLPWTGKLLTGTTQFRVLAADASEPPQNSPQPAGGAKLDAAADAHLDWGEAVDGLRGALIIRSPGPGKPEGIYLVVQNVSDAPVRFVDTVKTERLRTLYLSDTKGVLAGLSNDEPTKTDVTLQPREMVFLPMMRGDSTPEIAAGLIEGLRKDSLQTWRAVLRMNHAPEGWRGELTTGETRGALREGGPLPKNDRARALFKNWQNNARLNGDIPGGLVALLHEKVQEFIRNNEPDASGGPYAQKMKPLVPRFAPTGDWKPTDVIALLDDIAAAHTIPLETTLQHLTERTLQPGTPLPASLSNADWGEPLPSGLRIAHVLEPRAGAYHLGTELKARIVFHNSGPEPVAFITNSFQQPGHMAKRADGTELKIDSTDWLTLGSLAAYRLAPGEYCEIHTPGLGIGARVNDRDDWANVRAGSWILCAEEDEVVFTPGAAALSYRERAEPPGDWWLDFITERLNREAPVPSDTKEREYLLYRVVRDLYGAAPSTTEGDAFAADTSPEALKNLAALLAKHPYGKRSNGPIRAGNTKFRVLPPDTEAAARPRVATGPGWYSLSDNMKFSVTRRAAGQRVINEASLVHFQQGQDNVVHKVPLPDGHDTWAAATLKGTTVLWIAEAGALRKLDFTNPLQFVETRYENDQLREAPLSKELRVALDPVLTMPAGEPPNLKQPTTPPAADRPTAPVKDQPKDTTVVLTPESLLGTWRGKVNGENLLLTIHHPPAEAEVQLDIYFGDATIGTLAEFTIAPDGESVVVRQRSAGGGMPFGTLVPGAANQAPIFGNIPYVERLFRTTAGSFGTLKLKLDGRQQGQQEVSLTRDEQAPSTAPRQAEARALFELWQRTANADGTIPGTFIGQLATEVRAFVRHNPSLDSAMKMQSLLPRFVTSRDWTPAETIQLLDDVQYHHFQPIIDRVAKAKLPSGPLWRTMVEFQDIPVKIEKWSEPLRGLRLGMHVVEADWRPGGRARLELWLQNAGDQDVTFKSTGPDRQDVGISVAAIGTDGREHWGSSSSMLIIAPPMNCTLPPGHVAMAKSFEIRISRPDDTSAEWTAPVLRDLPAGDYKLRCSWIDAAGLAEGAEWKGTLTAPELKFTLAPQAPTESATPKAEAPKNAVAPAPTGVQGGPRAEVKPQRTHLWNDTCAAVAYQSATDVNFVLVYQGALSTGLSESWSGTPQRWSIEGGIHLVDLEKTKSAGRNVDKRVITVKYTSDEPAKLYLDGMGYDLASTAGTTATGALKLSGRIFILRDEGSPIQTSRTLPLRNQQDLVTIGDHAVHDRFMAESSEAGQQRQ